MVTFTWYSNDMFHYMFKAEFCYGRKFKSLVGLLRRQQLEPRTAKTEIVMFPELGLAFSSCFTYSSNPPSLPLPPIRSVLST